MPKGPISDFLRGNRKRRAYIKTGKDGSEMLASSLASSKMANDFLAIPPRSQERDWKFSRPLTGTTQVNSKRSAHNNGAKANRNSETRQVSKLRASKGLVSI